MRTSTITITQKGFKPRKFISTPDTVKYKVLSGSVLFEQLNGLFTRVNECRRRTQAIVNEFGATTWIGDSQHTLVGGITGFELDEKPDGWKQVHKALSHKAFFPKSIPKNKALLNRIADLPSVDRDDLSSIVCFKKQWVGLRQIISPGVTFGYDFHLIQIDEDAKYIPIEGMEEITVSEYYELKKIIDEASEKEVAE